MILLRRAPEIQIERVQFGHARSVVLESVRIRVIYLRDLRRRIHTMRIRRLQRMDLLRAAKQPKVRIRRRLEFIVRVNLHLRRMIHCNQLDLIQIRNLVQFFCDVHAVLAVFRLQRRTGNLMYSSWSTGK